MRNEQLQTMFKKVIFEECSNFHPELKSDTNYGREQIRGFPLSLSHLNCMKKPFFPFLAAEQDSMFKTRVVSLREKLGGGEKWFERKRGGGLPPDNL